MQWDDTRAQREELSLARLRDPENLEDPYPFYQRLRDRAPVRFERLESGNAIGVLTRYADVVAMLRDPRFSARRFEASVEWIPEELRPTLGNALLALGHQLLFLDPPDHTRLRGLVNHAFTPRVVEAMRPRIQRLVDELLDGAAARGQMEVIADFAFPLPVTVICEMLGVPPEDRQRVGAWTDDFATVLDGGDLTLETIVAALTGVAELMAYLRGIYLDHRARPRDDLMQAFISAEERGDTLSEEEVLANLVLLLAAGHGTTTHLIGNGLLALLRHPAQLALLREHPELAPGAVNELLRYDGPVQMTSRVPAEPVELAGHVLEPGQEVIAVLGAANRDPAQFAEPDALDLTRGDARQVAFGHGIHFCLGAPLARLEASIAFPALLRRFPRLRLLDERPPHQPGILFRALETLPVALE